MSTDPARAAGAALARCISCPGPEFAARYWSTGPLLSRAAELPGGPGGFADLFGPEAVDELVSTHGLRTPFARMAHEGTVLPTARFTRGGGAGATIADQLADDKVLVAMSEGATLVLQGLHRTWAPIVRFASALSQDLGHPVQVNSYVTPPENRGFAAHYDVHDVFVLQIAGRKRWTVHAPVIEAPLADQPWEGRRADVAARVQEPPLLDEILEPGDVLYLPRGAIHSAAALGETSIHLTIGIHPVTRRDLVRHLVDLSHDDAALRSSLPVGVDLTDPAVLADELVATVTALTARLGATAAADVARRVATDLMRSTRPEPVGPLAQLTASESLTQESVVAARGALRARLNVIDNGVDVILLDRTVTVPLVALDAVKTLLDDVPVRVGDLPGLGVDDRLALARRLMREGILVGV